MLVSAAVLSIRGINKGSELAVCLENLISEIKYSELSPSKNGAFRISSNLKCGAELLA